jgi:hypothetical protein
VQDVSQINQLIQGKLERNHQSEVTAVEAAQWLDQAGILKDSTHRPGLPLRNLLRAGLIEGQKQMPNGRWFIEKV